MSYRYIIEIALSAEKSILDNLFSKMQSNIDSNLDNKDLPWPNNLLWPEKLLYGLVDADIAKHTTGPIDIIERKSDHIYISIDAYCTGISLAAWEYLSDTIPGLKLDYYVSSWETDLHYSTDDTGHYFCHPKYHVHFKLKRRYRKEFNKKYMSASGFTITELIQNFNSSYGTTFKTIEELVEFYQTKTIPKYWWEDGIFNPCFSCYHNPDSDDEITKKYFYDTLL